MFKIPKLSTILLSVIALFLLAVATPETNAARTSDIWQERFGTYLETSWDEGRDILINGVNKYLNFGTTSGSSGYGIRDNAGTMEYKNDSGSWAAIGSGGGSGTPGGSNTQVQFNNGGSFAGDSGFTYSSSTDILSVVSINATNSTTTRLAVTGTGTSTFAGGINTGANHIVTHGVQSDSSDGLHIHAGNGTDVGLFGAGNTANSLFYGGVNIDGATRIATTTNGVLTATAGAITASGTPYVTSIVATGTTATSTLAGSLQVNDGTLFANSSLNRVGIGTTTPTQALSVIGNVLLLPTTTTTSGIIYKGTDRFIHDFNYGNNGTVTTYGFNTFVGVKSGNTTMGSSASSAFHSSYNTGLGYLTLTNNTTGFGNIAMGYLSLTNNTTGGGNTAVGSQSLQNNLGAFNNTAIGYLSMNANTNGSNNAGLGTGALYANTTGSNNIGIGTYAGRYLADGATANVGASSSIYIGQNVRSASAGSHNEIVIGGGLTGNGTNTITIGSSTNSTLFAGKVGIGTTTPSHNLTVTNSAYIGGSLTLLQALKDSTGATGTAGMVLQSTGTSTIWVATSTLGISGGGGGGGGALSTTTDIIGVPTSTPQEVSYVTGDVMFGGNSSTSAEFQLDDDGAQLIISSTTNSNATATIESGNNAMAVRIGDDSGVGIEHYFGSANKIISKVYGAITEWVMDFLKVSITGKLSVATTTYNGATTSDALVIDGYTNDGEWIEAHCTNPMAEITQIGADSLRSCGSGRYAFIEDTNGVIDFVQPTTGTSSYFRIRTGAAGTTNVAGDGMAIGWAGGIDFGDIQKWQPAMEFPIRTDAMGNATSAIMVAGITDKIGVSADLATEPTQGIYLVASSTTANWQLACNPSTGATTYVDTGIATTTVTSLSATTNNPWIHFRLEVDGTNNANVTATLKARTASNRTMTQIASCAIDVSASTAQVAPTIGNGRVSAGTLSAELHVMWLKFWYKQPVF